MTTATLYSLKEVDETRDNAAAALDSELYLDLEAGTAYWIEAVIGTRSTYDYGGRCQYHFDYDATLVDSAVHCLLRSMPCYYTTRYEDRGLYTKNLLMTQSDLATVEEVTSSISSPSETNHRGVIWLSGRITTDTAGRFGFKWNHSDRGGSYLTTVFAGSFIYATPLDICPL